MNILFAVEVYMCTESPSKPSSPTLLPKGEGSHKYVVHYRGSFSYAGLVDIVRELRQKETKAEKVAWYFLRNKKFLGLKFRRQHQISLYIVDFYCDELKLILVLDGNVHLTQEQKEKDRI